MRTAFVLYGPKAAGKTWIARILEEALGVAHVNADKVIPRLLSEGRRPHPEDGWLQEIETEVLRAADDSGAVSVEATGAWDSDWRLPDDLAAEGLGTRRVWVWAPLEVCLARLHARPFPAPVPEHEAKWIHTSATEQAASRFFDLMFDTSIALDEEDVARAVRPLLGNG